jgi:hypothetical protein
MNEVEPYARHSKQNRRITMPARSTKRSQSHQLIKSVNSGYTHFAEHWDVAFPTP